MSFDFRRHFDTKPRTPLLAIALIFEPLVCQKSDEPVAWRTQPKEIWEP